MWGGGGGTLGSLIFGNDHMSVRLNSLYNPVSWTTRGGPCAFGGFVAGQKKGLADEGFQPNTVLFKSQIDGILFWGGGVPTLLGLVAQFLHLTTFLLFVPNTRVLTASHMTFREIQ